MIKVALNRGCVFLSGIFTHKKSRFRVIPSQGSLKGFCNVRELRSRNEVDAMYAGLLEDNRQYLSSLKDSLKYTPDFGDNQEMTDRWKIIRLSLFNDLNQILDDYASVDSVLGYREYFKTCLLRYEKTNSEINEFRLKYADFLSEKNYQYVYIFENAVEFDRLITDLYLNFISDINEDDEIVIKIKAHLSWVKNICDIVIPFVKNKEFPLYAIKNMIYLFNGKFSNPLDFLQQYINESVDRNKNYSYIFTYIDNYSRKINEFSRDLENKLFLSLELRRETIDLRSESASVYTDQSPESITYRAIQSCLDGWDEWSDAMDTLARN